jgi:ubiquinone/menaquinone biosynthesis C-methylase UbiE
LTPEFIDTAKVICGWVGLDNRVSLHLGSALAMPFADRVFDCAYMLHVGMNISDKAKLCSEVSRVLQPNSLFGIYDVMRIGDGELAYPVHWARAAAESAVAKPAQYREALEKAGFIVIAERNRRDFALAQYDQLRAKTAAAENPPPLGLHILMGSSTPDFVQNMIENVSAGRIAPVELIGRKL